MYFCSGKPMHFCSGVDIDRFGGRAVTKKLPKVATEMALNVLAYNMKRVMAIIGVGGLLEAMRA
jgi:hypothetical protein